MFVGCHIVFPATYHFDFSCEFIRCPFFRQFFTTIPLELYDIATIDGTKRSQVLLYINPPQAQPAPVSVATFDIFYSGNDFCELLICLRSPGNWTPSVALQTYSALHTVITHLITAVSLLEYPFYFALLLKLE